MNQSHTNQEQHLDQITRDVERWLKNIVVGLGLCPFAATPLTKGLIRLAVYPGKDLENLLLFVEQEFQRLEQTDPSDIETTLVIAANCLEDFYDYNQYLDVVDSLIAANDWQGVYQVASFHPNYQFAGTEPDDRENLTNRAPAPIFHLLREASLEAALNRYPNPDRIPEKNIECMEAMAEETVKKLFYYLIHP
jgi:hypothetical protein